MRGNNRGVMSGLIHDFAHVVTSRVFTFFRKVELSENRLDFEALHKELRGLDWSEKDELLLILVKAVILLYDKSK